MATSGTYGFQLSNASVIYEAFDRIQIRPSAVDRHMLLSARNSLNLELLDWSNRTFNYWKLTSGTINLAAATATYTLPANLVTVEEVYYTSVNAGGSGVNADRIMVPMSRSEFAMLVNKNQEGIPTKYWFQMLSPAPQMTIWEVPAPGQVAPAFVVNWYGLQQIQDATLNGGETPDIHYRATDALCARLALRLCEKFGGKNPQERQMLMVEKKALADDAWGSLERRDQEPGPTIIRPNVGVYAIKGGR